jgi:hypothetical protein
MCLRGGGAAPYKQMSRYLKVGHSGEIIRLVAPSDFPGRAEFKVAWHLLDRRGHPSSKEGKNTWFKLIPFLDNSRQLFVFTGDHHHNSNPN